MLAVVYETEVCLKEIQYWPNPNSASNTFVMMRFASEGSNPQILESIRLTLGRYGITVLRADDKAFSDSLWANVTAYMTACDLGVAVFEQLQQLAFNPNVSLELGYMLALGRKVLLLKERQLPLMPTDILGHLYTQFYGSNITETVTSAANSWLRDIGIAKAHHEKIVVFVSYGGTCRCAMSKVIARQAFVGRALPFALYALNQWLLCTEMPSKQAKERVGLWKRYLGKRCLGKTSSHRIG